MKIPEETKNKLKEFLGYIENSSNINSDDAINKFKILFKEQYIEEENSVNEAYFQSVSKNFYLKEGYGIALQVNSGDWDRYGSRISHVGKDIVLYSLFSKVEEYRKGYRLFFEDEKIFKQLPKNIYEIFNIDLSQKSLIEKANDIEDLNSVYKILPNEIKNNNDVAFERYLHLKDQAAQKHKEERWDGDISPYDYVVVHSIEEILMEYIEKYGDNEFFKNRALALYNLEFGGYLDAEIKNYKNAVHIIENKNEYLKLIRMEDELEHDEEYFNYVKETLSELEDKLESLMDKYNSLNNKKYNLIEIIKSIPKKDKETMLQLGDSELKNGEIELVKKELEEWKNIYAKHKEYYKALKEKHNSLQKKLEIPFDDYSEEYEVCDYDKGWKNVSLNYLLENSEYYKEILKHLQSKKEIAENLKDYAKLYLETNNEIIEEEGLEM